MKFKSVLILQMLLALLPALTADLAQAANKRENKVYGRAKELASFGEHEEALKLYNQAMAEKPDWDIYKARGRTYEHLKRFKEAIADYTKCIDERPNFWNAPYHMRGRCYQELGDYKKAIQDFTTGLKIENSTYKNKGRLFAIHMSRGRSYDLSKQDKKAIADYTECLKLSPSDPDCGTVMMWRKKVVARTEK